jgi:hypothetical protein
MGPIITIVFTTMERLSIDAYVIDVLMPDLVGHDRRPATGDVCRVSVPASTGSEGTAGYCFSQSTDHCGKNWIVKINGADRVAASATKNAHRSERCCDRDRAGATGDATMGAGLAGIDVLCFAPIGCGKAVTAGRRLRVDDGPMRPSRTNPTEGAACGRRRVVGTSLIPRG